MKYNLFLLLVIATVLSSCHYEKPPVVLSNQIEYDVWVEGDPLQASYVSYVEGKNRHLILEIVFDKLNNGEGIDVFGNPLNPDYLYAGFSDFDSSLMVTKTSVISLIEQGIIPIKGFRFREHWSYNSETLELYKQVNGIAPLWCIKDTAGNWTGASPLFWVLTDSAEENAEVSYQALTDIIQYDVIINNSITPISAMYADCPYYLFNIEEKDRTQYIKLMIDLILSNKIKAYDYFFSLLPEADKQLLNGRKDTLVDIDEASGKTITSVSDIPLPIEDFARFKFIEKWEYSKTPFIFHKSVFALNPSLVSYDDEGQFEGFKPLFWLFFNEDMRLKVISLMQGS